MKLNHLPDDCMLELFHRIPLRSRIHATQLVCRRWRHMHLTACRHRTTTVALFVDNLVDSHWLLKNQPLCNKNYHLLLTEQNLTFKRCTFLVDLFPNISRLDLVQQISTKQIDKIVRLLDALSGKLVNLKLFFISKNYLGSRQRVEKNTSVYKLLEEVLLPDKFPQLRSFTLCIRCVMPELYPNDGSLFTTAGCYKLEELSLLSIPINVQRVFLQENNLFTSLRRLTLECGQMKDNDYPILKDFAQRYFSQLTHLTVYSFGRTICEIIRNYCEKLTTLRLQSTRIRPLADIGLSIYSQKYSLNLKCLSLNFVDYGSGGDFSREFWHFPKTENDIFTFPSLRTLILRAPSWNLLPYRNPVLQACALLSLAFPAITSLTIEDKFSRNNGGNGDTHTPAEQLLDAMLLNRRADNSSQELEQEKAQLLTELTTLLSEAKTKSDVKAIRLAKMKIAETLSTSSKLVKLNELVSKKIWKSGLLP